MAARQLSPASDQPLSRAVVDEYVGAQAIARGNALRLVYSAADHADQPVWFCGRCAAPSPLDEPPAPYARVCPSCGLGLLLETRADGKPEPDDAFLVVDASLAVQALSERAEELLEVTEPAAVGRPVRELLAPAGAEDGNEPEFIRALIDAASGGDGFKWTFVRPRNTFGVRLRARIGACGPPRGVLIVLESGRSRLRIV